MGGKAKNIKRILNELLKDNEIKVCCFQEVNKNNMENLNEILESNNFKMLDKFPMKTQSIKQYNNYITLSRNSKFNMSDNSWQGYGTQEQVNVDFAFIEKGKKDCFEYEIIKQNNMMDEGSDHRSVLITIKE